MNVDHLLGQTCTVFPDGIQDRFAKPIYSTGVDYACRFQSTSRIIQLPNGEKTPIDGILTLAASAIVSINNKITFNGINYRVMAISPAIDGSGVTRHFRLMISKWNTG